MFTKSLSLIFLLFALANGLNISKIEKKINAKVWVHFMPWFETRQTSTDGQWGIHWTMDTRNPDIIDGTGRRQIAAYYYPLDGPYGSGDPAVIQRQLLELKYAGVDGILLDWPGMTRAWDYPKNHENCLAIIQGIDSVGLEFAIVYEDHNLGMAHDAGLLPDIMAQARADMEYLRNTWFHKANYIRIHGAPLLLDFGPQTLTQPWQWAEAFSVLPEKPTFLTLWYQMPMAGVSARGEYPWIYHDFLVGLDNFYRYRPLETKFGVAYPGFHSFYYEGGWGGPGWSLPHNGLETFRATLNMAIYAGLEWIQVATWNDIGEGTMIEPTREFGYGFLEIIQYTTGVQYTKKEFEIIRQLYRLRKANEGNAKVQLLLEEVANALIELKPDEANRIIQNNFEFQLELN